MASDKSNKSLPAPPKGATFSILPAGGPTGSGGGGIRVGPPGTTGTSKSGSSAIDLDKKDKGGKGKKKKQAAGADSSQEKKALRRIWESVKKAPTGRSVPALVEVGFVQQRGRYLVGDSGDYFVPCDDTVRFNVLANSESEYYFKERMRLFVRRLNSPVYAVVWASEVVPTPGTPGADSIAKVPEGQRVRQLYVTRVDTISNRFPKGCTPYLEASALGDR